MYFTYVKYSKGVGPTVKQNALLLV